MPETSQVDGLRKVLAVVAGRYGPEFAADFADMIVAELNAMPREVH
jgi:hypothetical protein